MSTPHADVDSGTLIVIDPCYIENLLTLTPSQRQQWQNLWMAAAQIADTQDGIAPLRPPGRAGGIILTCFGGDGRYGPDAIAKILTRTHEDVCSRVDHTGCKPKCGS